MDRSPSLTDRAYELRTYTLRDATAAQAYSQRWKAHITSLHKFHIKTKAVFIGKSDPKQVIALVQYAVSDDPQVVTKNYMASVEFKKDMEGFDMTSF